MGIPILRLPVVALTVLLNHLNNVGLVTVSLLSKRADWFLKACGKRNVTFFNLSESEIRDLRKVRILELFLLECRRQGELPEWNFKMFCSVDLHLSINCRLFTVSIYSEDLEGIDWELEEKYGGKRRNLKIGDSSVPALFIEEDGEAKIRTFWSNKTDGIIVYMDHFKKKFNLPIEKMEFSGNDTRTIRTIVDHINSTQTVVKKVHIGSYSPVSEDDFKFIMKNISATESFTSHWESSQNFEFDGTIRAKNLDIENGHWFSIQNLLASENEVIYVNGSDYSKEELRLFLKEWREGKLPKLKEVELATKVSPMDVIEGYERWGGRCRECENWNVIPLKWHGNCHGGVHTSDREGFYMSIHEN